MLWSFTDFVREDDLKKRATSNIKIQEIPDSVGIDNVGIYLSDGPFSSDIEIVTLHPVKGTPWVCYVYEIYFDSNGCVPPRKLSKFIIKQNGYCLYSEYRIQKIFSHCASFCLFILYLTKVIGVDFKSAVLNLYYQRFSWN